MVMEIVKSMCRTVCFLAIAPLVHMYPDSDGLLYIVLAGIVGSAASLGWSKESTKKD